MFEETTAGALCQITLARIEKLRSDLIATFGNLNLSPTYPQILVARSNRDIPFVGRSTLTNEAKNLFTRRKALFDANERDRTKHPVGLLGGCSGLGKTRGLLEIGDELEKPDFLGPDKWLVKVVVSYNNGNPPLQDRELYNRLGEEVGAAKSLCLRILFFAFFPRGSFTEFSQAFPTETLNNLDGSLVVGLIMHIASEHYGNTNGSLFLAVDDVNYLLDGNYAGKREGTVVVPTQLVFKDLSCPVENFTIDLLRHTDLEILLDRMAISDVRWVEWKTCRALRLILSDYASLPRMGEKMITEINKCLDNGNELKDIDFEQVVDRLKEYLPKDLEFSAFANRIVMDTLLANHVDRLEFVDDRSKYSYEELELSGVIALATIDNKTIVQLPFSFFRLYVSKLKGADDMTKALRLMCSMNFLTWQGFEDLHAQMEALREMLLARCTNEDIIDCNSFYCIDDKKYSTVDECAQLKLRTNIPIGTARFPFPNNPFSFIVVSETGESIDSQVCSVKNCGGPSDTFTVRHVRYSGIERARLFEHQDVSSATSAETTTSSNAAASANEGWIPTIFCGKHKLYSSSGAVSGNDIHDEAIKVSKSLDCCPHILIIVAIKLTNDAIVDLPTNCIVVSGSVLEKFYGPVFSSRARLFMSSVGVNVNTATKSELLTIHGLEKLSRLIIEERYKRGHYLSWKDLSDRVKRLPRAIENYLAFD